MNQVRITLGSETATTTAATPTSIFHQGIDETTAMSDANAAPTMPTPMPIAATELAIAAPACEFCPAAGGCASAACALR